MTREYDEPLEDDDAQDDDVDLIGGGGPASVIDDFEGDEDELDTHGDNLSPVDEDDL